MTQNSCPYFLTQDLTSLNCLLSPLPPSTRLRLSANGAPRTMLFWMRKRHHLLEQLKSPYREMWEQCWVPCKVRRMASLMFCGWAPKQLGLYPEYVQLPHENIPFGFLSKPFVYMRAHEALTALPFPPSFSLSLSCFPRQLCHQLPPCSPANRGPVHFASCKQMLEVWRRDHQFNQQPTSKSHFGLSYNTLQCEFSNSRFSVRF